MSTIDLNDGFRTPTKSPPSCAFDTVDMKRHICAPCKLVKALTRRPYAEGSLEAEGQHVHTDDTAKHLPFDNNVDEGLGSESPVDSGSAPCTPKNQPTRPVEPTTETLRSDPSVVHSLAFPDSVHRSEDEANGTDPNCAQTPVVAEDRSTPDGLVAQTLGTVKRSALSRGLRLGICSVSKTLQAWTSQTRNGATNWWCCLWMETRHLLRLGPSVSKGCRHLLQCKVYNMLACAFLNIAFADFSLLGLI